MSNPFYYAVVWRSGNDKLIGDILTLQEYRACLQDGYELHAFSGRLATVCVLSFEPEITRGNKLDFAIAFMKGKYVTISVDLKNLTSTVTYGKPPP